MWKEIPDWPGRFVNETGEVLSKVQKKSRILAQHPDVSGYMCVIFTNGRADRKMMRVHQLVTQAFHGPKPKWAQCTRHLNGDRKDNRVCNLVWGTLKENSADRMEHGNYSRGKLLSSEIARIFILRKAGKTLRFIADIFGIEPQAVRYWLNKPAT